MAPKTTCFCVFRSIFIFSILDWVENPINLDQALGTLFRYLQSNYKNFKNICKSYNNFPTCNIFYLAVVGVLDHCAKIYSNHTMNKCFTEMCVLDLADFCLSFGLYCHLKFGIFISPKLLQLEKPNYQDL